MVISLLISLMHNDFRLQLPKLRKRKAKGWFINSMQQPQSGLGKVAKHSNSKHLTGTYILKNNLNNYNYEKHENCRAGTTEPAYRINLFRTIRINRTINCPLSSPGKPYSLKVHLVTGSIKVAGYDGKDINQCYSER